MSDEVYEKIKGIITELLDVEDDLVELIMEFEERFGGEISDEDAQKITTVGEAVDYVKTRMS